MGSKRLVVPEHGGYGRAYELSFKLASERIARIDIEQQCLKSGAQYRVKDSQKAIVVPYLNQLYLINLPDIKISLEGSAEEVPIRDKLLIIHYFISAKGTLLTKGMITFRELPEGNVYFPTFSKRSIKPLVDNFGNKPGLLLELGKKLGGHKAEYGDEAVTIDAFPRVPITVVLWEGDDEFAPQGNILFDATISDYLPTEDITVLCETIAWKLVRFK